MSRSRHWCFTLNNYNEEDYALFLEPNSSLSYCCVGKEVGDSGTPHLQGFLSFSNARRLNGVTQAYFAGRGHWEISRSPSKAADYCKKDGN